MFTRYLLSHNRDYPLMRVEDYVKLIYQSVYGAHADVTAVEALNYISAECATLQPDATLPLYQEISPSLVRVNLAACLAKGISLYAVAAAFSLSACQGDEQLQTDEITQKCKLLIELCRQKKINLSANAVTVFTARYMANPVALSHSYTYKANYAPHYRVVKRCLLPLIFIITAIEKQKGGTVLVALDGCSGSGKSFYGDCLKKVYGARCNVFHTDDFFLPNERKTPQRLAQIGGNVDYESLEQLLKSILSGGEIVYSPFDCATQQRALPVAVPPAQINVCEGVYAAHPALAKYYDALIMLTLSKQLQRKRLARRNPALYSRFVEEWLPLEQPHLALLARRKDVTVIDVTPYA